MSDPGDTVTCRVLVNGEVINEVTNERAAGCPVNFEGLGPSVEVAD